MKPVLRICAVIALSLTLTLSAFAGTIHSPGAVDPPPEPTASSTNITTTVILEILSVIS